MTGSLLLIFGGCSISLLPQREHSSTYHMHRVGCAVPLTIPHLGNFDIVEVAIDSGGN